MLASLAGRGSWAGLGRLAARRVAERVRNHGIVPQTASCGHVERAMGRFGLCRLSPRSSHPVATFKPSRVARVGQTLPCGPCRLWPGLTGCRRISLCSGEQLKTCAGWGVQISWRTSRPVAILSTPRDCSAVLRPCCAVSQLARCFAKFPTGRLCPS